MLSIDDIKYVSFRKTNMRGYRPEDVDNFVDDVQETVEKLLKEKDELEKKLSVLAGQVKKYKDDEEYLKETLLNAKRLSEASLKEAKQKSEKMLELAKKNCSEILVNANAEADKIILRAKNDLESKKSELYEMKKEAISFRTNLLKMYKEHLKLIDAFPNADKIKRDESINVKEDTNKEVNTIANDNNVTGSIEKVNEEVNKLLKKEAHSADKNEQTSSDDNNTEQNKNKFTNLKFGENYNIRNDEEIESPANLLRRK